jgi:hypothetical protein
MVRDATRRLKGKAPALGLTNSNTGDRQSRSPRSICSKAKTFWSPAKCLVTASPILYVFLARTSKTIHEVNFVRLDEQGNLHIADELEAVTRVSETNKAATSSGIKIVFSDGSGPRQTLYYFSTNLADGSFQRSGFAAFLAKLGPADSLIKSASYLLHGAHFAGVRELWLADEPGKASREGRAAEPHMTPKCAKGP